MEHLQATATATPSSTTYNEGPPPERSGEGGSSLHGQQLLHGGAGTPNEGQLGHASNTKACFDEKNDKADP